MKRGDGWFQANDAYTPAQTEARAFPGGRGGVEDSPFY